jgi:23S rRNA pseudouridine2605 synthase
VKVSGKPAEADIAKLREGIFLPAERSRLKSPEALQTGDAGRRRSTAVRTAPARIKLVRDAANPWYEITLIEGRNRQIRRMFEQIEHHVEKIKRVRYGPLELDVEPGKFRALTAQEVTALKTAVSSPRGNSYAMPQEHKPRKSPAKSRRPGR